LNNRPYLVLLASRTLNLLGYAFAPVALAFGILHVFGDQAGASILSYVMTSLLVPQVLLMLFGGIIADRYPRAVVLRLGAFTGGIGYVLIGVLLLYETHDLLLLCGAAVFTGLAGAVIYPAFTGIIPDLVPQEHRQQGNAWLAMGQSVARLVGMVASGAVVVMVGGGWAVIIAGLMYIGAGLMTLFLPKIAVSGRGDTNMIRELAQGWGEFRSRQWLWVAVVQFGILNMVLSASHGVLGPLVAEQELGGAAAWTAILAGEGVGAIVGVAVSLAYRPKYPIRVAVLLTFFSAGPGLLLGLAYPVWSIVIASALLGFGFELLNVLWMTTMQTEVPPQSLGRVASYDAFGSIVLGPVGTIIAAPLAASIGVHDALLATGLVILAATALALCAPEVRNLRSRRPAVPASEQVVAS
jgi:MFS family permease